MGVRAVSVASQHADTPSPGSVAATIANAARALAELARLGGRHA
jgi:hypothetical protein